MRPPADPASVVAIWAWVSVIGLAAAALILIAWRSG